MRVLLLSEAPMSLHEGGICQTLYNVFCFIEPNDFLGIAPIEELQIRKADSKYVHRYEGYKFQWVGVPRNRLARYISPVATWINFSILRLRSFKRLKQQISSFDPDIIVSCPNSPVGAAIHSKLLGELSSSRHEIIPYFMDDWMFQSRLTWLGGSVQKSVEVILTKSKRWMMIGKELATILQERYHAMPEQVLCIRNPVDIEDAPEPKVYRKGNPYTIAYAGALWDMHYDSFCLMAKAVSLLAKSISIQLVLYCPTYYWEWRKKELEPLGVKYKGLIPYAELHNTLNYADALLITSSFSPALLTHAKGSLQTKITDYCKSRRLIISCGPSYSANHTFIKENNCGICIEFQDVNSIEAELANIVANADTYQDKIDNAWKILVRDFTKTIVHGRVKSFLLKNSKA